MTRRERNLARLTESRLREVYDVLVRNCGASPDDEGRFLADMSYRLGSFSLRSPWRFDGYLDSGGFFFNDDGLPAICARLGDLDLETRSMLTGVHRLYLELVATWKREDYLARARERRAAKRALRDAERASRLAAQAPRERLGALAQ